MSLNPEQCAGNAQERAVAGAGLVVPAGDSPVPLQVVEEALDLVAKAIKRLVVPPLPGPLLAGGDDGLLAAGCQVREDRIRVIAAISDARIADDKIDQLVCDRAVVLLAGSDQNLERPAALVNDRVDLRREPTTGSPDVVFLGPPSPPAAS